MRRVIKRVTAHLTRRNGVSMDIRELRTEHTEFSGEIMDRVLRSAILNSNVINVIQDNKRPFDELMSKYRCAIMEIETKFKVLNERFSLQYDRNPIETIKTRLKSAVSWLKKENPLAQSQWRKILMILPV